MIDDSGQIVSLLTEIRNDQREQLALSQTTALRQKRMLRIWYALIVLLMGATAYVLYPTFHH